MWYNEALLKIGENLNLMKSLNSTIHRIEILYQQLRIMGTSQKIRTTFV